MKIRKVRNWSQYNQKLVKIASVDFTTANKHDQVAAEGLVMGDEKCLYADKGYDAKKLKNT